MFSHNSDHWSTPKNYYDEINKEFNFTFDPCPLRCADENALFIEWHGRVFVNPPYSNIRNFIEKGILEVKKGNAEYVVFLVPVRTDTKWFHDLVYNKYELRFIKGRLKFGTGQNSAPFPSMLIIVRPCPFHG